MNKVAVFLDKNYFYIIIFLILMTISGSIFVLRNKNNAELTKKIGDQYLNIIMSNAKGEFSDEQIAYLKKISTEKNNFGALSSILLSSSEYKKNDFTVGNDALMKVINDKGKNKVLRDYALYIYAHSLLGRSDLQKFSEIMTKLMDKSQIFYNNNIELIAIYNIYQKNYMDAIKIIDEKISSINNIDTLQSRLNDIKHEAQDYLS